MTMDVHQARALELDRTLGARQVRRWNHKSVNASPPALIASNQ